MKSTSEPLLWKLLVTLSWISRIVMMVMPGNTKLSSTQRNNRLATMAKKDNTPGTFEKADLYYTDESVGQSSDRLSPEHDQGGG